MGELDWVEIMYKAYITAVVSLATLFTLAAIVGDTPISQATLNQIKDDGPAWIGLFVAVGVALGLRSGSRGGPLALEAPDVEHVLLAPVDRGLVLRGSAWRQARGVALTGFVGGALAGLLMAQRVPGYDTNDVAAWMVAGTVTGALALFAVWGGALIGSGRRLGTLGAALIGGVLVAWSVIDIAAGTITSPASMLGALAIWPLEIRLIAPIGVAAAIAVPVFGMLGIGNSSVEAAQRRSGLVGALRFAATTARPDLVAADLPLSATVGPVRVRGGVAVIRRLFDPLGYEVTADPVAGTDGKAPVFWMLTLAATTRLQALLSHLYVLIPVLDDDKHYWVSEDEIEKLLRHGEGWLAGHPDREFITRRYLRRGPKLARQALNLLAASDEDGSAATAGPDPAAPAVEEPASLNDLRYQAVMQALQDAGAAKVLDLGCGEGKLLRLLMQDSRYTHVTGADVSPQVLDIAQDRLNLDRLPDRQRERLTLLQTALTYRDRRLQGHDAAALVEVVEHVDPGRLPAFRACRLRLCPPRHRRPHHAEPGLERRRPRPSRRPAAPPRPPLRVDARRVHGLDGAGRRRVRLPRGPARHRRPAPEAWRPHADGGVHVRLSIPDFSLVLMMGASGSGKSTFAARNFLPTEILSSDRCRGMVADDEGDQAATADAFDVLHFIAAKRLAARRLTVIDATNLREEDRKHAIALARRYHALPVVFALDVPEAVCAERNRARPDRAFGSHVVRNHVQLLRRSLRGLQREGFRIVHTLSSVEAAGAAEVVREPLFTDRRGDAGPFDIIGDVHGCLDELTGLLRALGYADDGAAWRHADGRRALFLGDLVDRGPDSPGVLRLVMDMVSAGAALCVQGNHDVKLVRHLSGRDVKLTHGLAETTAQLDALPDDVRLGLLAEARSFLDGLRSHYWAGRRQAGRRPRRAEGGDARTRLRGSPQLRAVWRDDGGNRRVRPARPLRMGARLPRRGDGRLWPHACAGAGVAEPDDLHRHRLRVRRHPDGATLPGARVGVRPRRADLLRTGPSAADRQDDAGCLRPAGPGGRVRQACRHDRPDGDRHRAGGERGGGVGGHEPVLRGPALVDLPAAYHVPVRDQQSGRPAGAS